MNTLIRPLILLLLIPFASAHGFPVEYSPDLSTVSWYVPEKASIVFSERIEKTSSIQILGPDKSLASQHITFPDDHTVQTTILNKGEGTYTVTWQIQSADDGHFTDGTYYFVVSNKPAPEAHGFLFNQNLSFQTLTIFLEFLGGAILIGALALHRKKRLFLTGCTLYLAGVIGTTLFSITTLAQLSHLNESLSLFILTTTGQLLIFQIVLSTLLLFALHRGFKNPLGLLPLYSLLILPRAFSSHAAAHSTLAVIMNFIHLVFKELWVGILIIMLFLPKLKTRLFSLSLIVGGFTGAYLIWIHLKHLSNLTTTHWGTVFIYLALFAMALIALRLRKNTHLELLVGLTVLLISAHLTLITPPQESFVYNVQREATVDDISILLEPHPFEDNMLLLTLLKQNKPLPTKEVLVSLENIEPNKLFPQQIPVIKRTDHRFIFSTDHFTAPGTWVVDAYAFTPTQPTTARFTVLYPELLSTSPKKTALHWTLIAICILLIPLAIVLQPSSKKSNLPTSLLAFLLLLLIVVSITQTITASPFKSACENWQEFFPMRDGKVLSLQPQYGCTLDNNHFVDYSEYTYFVHDKTFK